MTQPPFVLEGTELLASALHAQLLGRRRGTFEHDLKNVMHGLLSGTELLDKALTMSSPRITPAECLRLLQQQLGRTQSVLDGLLEEIAPVATDARDFDCGELLEECVRDLRHPLQRVNLTTQFEPRLLVHARRARVKDVLLALLLDAIDRTPPHAAVTLRAVPDAHRARVELQHEQAAASDSSALQVAAALLQAENVHNGLASTANATERRITLLMPLAPTRERATAATPRLVIVDANRDAADSLAMLVQLEGFEATAAYDVQTALQQARALVPAAVLLDVDGSIDSEAFVRGLRDELPHTHVIGLSHTAERRSSAVQAQLRKPLDFAALRTLLQDA